MPRTTNEKHRKNKIRKILESARIVFYRKGFINVTMQDIIDECRISRGGIYLYFNSVDEIFQEVIRKRNKEKFSVLRKSVDDYEPFASVLNDYLALQKERLLNMENSLFRALVEYNFSNLDGTAQEFRNMQLAGLRKSVLSILSLGVGQRVLRDKNIPRLADHFIVVIDGLSVFALAGLLTEEIIDEQFMVLVDMIQNIRV